MTNDAAASPAKVVLLTREQCHLCDDVRAVVDEVCRAAGERWVETDVDDDPELRAEYGDRVPVVLVNNAEFSSYTVDRGALARAIGHGE